MEINCNFYKIQQSKAYKKPWTEIFLFYFIQ